MSLGLFLIHFCINFRLDVKLIYQYKSKQAYDYVLTVPADMRKYIKCHPELQDSLEPLLKNVNPHDYYFLVVHGGEIKSLSMKKNKNNELPCIKYKKNVSPYMVSYYLIPNTRYIDFLKLTKWYHT